MQEYSRITKEMTILLIAQITQPLKFNASSMLRDTLTKTLNHGLKSSSIQKNGRGTIFSS